MTPKQSTIEAEAKEKAKSLYKPFKGMMVEDKMIIEHEQSAYELGYIAGATNRPEPINTEELRNDFVQHAWNNGKGLTADKIFDWFLPHLRSNVDTTTEGCTHLADGTTLGNCVNCGKQKHLH